MLRVYRAFFVATIYFLFGCGIELAVADTYPSRPVRIIVPSAAEAGLPEFQVVGWNGYLVPAGTPPDIVATLHKEMTAALRGQEFAAWIENSGSELVASTPQQFSSVMQSELVRWKRIVEEAGVSAQ